MLLLQSDDMGVVRLERAKVRDVALEPGAGEACRFVSLMCGPARRKPMSRSRSTRNQSDLCNQTGLYTSTNATNSAALDALPQRGKGIKH